MLDPLRARAEADAAQRRGAGTLWGAGPVALDRLRTTAGAWEYVLRAGRAVGEWRSAR